MVVEPPRRGDMIDVPIGAYAILRMEIVKEDRERGYYVMRVVKVYKDKEKAESIGQPTDEEGTYDGAVI